MSEEIADKVASLTDIISRHVPEDGLHPSALPGVQLARASAPTLPMPVVYQPTLCMIAQGRKRVVLGGKDILYDPASFLVASVDLPIMGSVVTATADEPYLSLQIALDPEVLSDLVLKFPSLDDADAPVEEGLQLHTTSPALFDATHRLVALLDTPDDIEALAPLIMREILYRLMTDKSSGPTIRQMARDGSRLNQISRAILWIRTQFHEACPIDDAAEIAGMSRSSFHAHFKAITSMTPIEFRTRLRLQEAQRLMVGKALDAASAGFRVGYESPSQFSRDYARIFGMPPARHASQLRDKIVARNDMAMTG